MEGETRPSPSMEGEMRPSPSMEGETRPSVNPLPQNVLFRKKIGSQQDMREVELEIICQMGGERRQCAFLRSRDYVALRLTALYPTLAGLQDKAPMTSYSGRLSVCLTCEDGTGVITLRSFDNLVYQEGWAPELEEMDEEENPPERGVKQRLK